MAAEDIDLKLKVRGALQAARDARKVAGAVDDIGDKARKTDRQVRRAGRGFSFLAARGKAAKGVTAGMGVGFRGLSTGATIAAGGIAAAAFEGKRAVDAFQESRRIQADQAQALKTTGAHAWTTAGQLDALATAQSKRTGVDDEAIAKSQTMLLTFTQIRNEAGKGGKVFDRASQSVLDLSARFGKDLNSSAVMVGKALNDPVKGVTALQRVGVSFTKDQRKQIETLVATGKTQEAQRVILRELEKQTKGSAAAQATATDRMKVAWGNVEEALGKGLTPMVDLAAKKLTSFAEDIAPRMEHLSDELTGIFKRKDLSFDQKVELGFKATKKEIQPVIREIGREFDRSDLPEKIGHAVQDAIPKIMEAMGRGGLLGAGAFWKGFKSANIGGKLAVIALLGFKTGLFGAVGRKAASSMASAFLARWAARGVGTSAAETTVAQGTPGFKKAGGRWGRLAGKGFAVGFAALMVAEAPNIMAEIGDALLGEDNPFSDEARDLGLGALPIPAIINPSPAGEDDNTTDKRHGPKGGPGHWAWDASHTRRVWVPDKAPKPKAVPAGVSKKRAGFRETPKVMQAPEVIRNGQPIEVTTHTQLVTPAGRVWAEEVAKHTAHRKARK